MIDNVDDLIDHGNKRARTDLLDIATAALKRVHPSHTVPAHVERDGPILRVGDRTFDITEFDDIYIIGAGKGSLDLVDALVTVLDVAITDGIVAEKDVSERTLDTITVLEAGHPLPDQASLETGSKALELADNAGPDDVVFACITGGASAQCILPADGVSLAALRRTTKTLLEAGAPIEDVNAVRKHLSQIKGGQLTQRIAPAQTVTLVVVDEVAGEPWGPTVADMTTFDDARKVLDRHEVTDRTPEAVRNHLRRGADSKVPETPDQSTIDSLPTHTVVLADAADLCEVARDRAAALGYNTFLLSTSLEGESSEVATVLSGIVREICLYDRPIAPPCVVITGGETTVTVTDDSGDGGPNQEFALAFALEIEDCSSVTALAFGTDGTDGPTPFAGGLVDGCTAPSIRATAIDPLTQLQNHNSSEALSSVNDAVITGSTGTNVMDLRLILIDSH